jgi:aminoglycoside 6'-N-acetyltransferase
MITLRSANIDDLLLLKYWDQQPHVIAANPNDEWEWETELLRSPEWRELLMAENDDRSVGFVQIIDPALEESHYWGETGKGFRAIDLWIGEVSDLGKGYGTEMMKQAIVRCFASPEVNTILIDPLASNTRAHNFYKRFGFRFVERRFFGKDDCFVFKLERKYWPG